MSTGAPLQVNSLKIEAALSPCHNKKSMERKGRIEIKVKVKKSE
jgi:hypothetical protein